MNFSGVPYNSLLGSVLRYPLRWIPRALIVPILQGRLRGKKWIVGSSTHGCWLGSYEYDKQRRFERFVHKGDVLYDVGAHVGFYTLLACELVGASGQVIAFEPLPRNLRFLRQHLALNNYKNVTVIEAVVSDEPSTVRFEEGPSSQMGFASEHGSLEFISVSLDESYAKGGIPKPDVIKMDIEGGEYRALNGAKCLLGEARPVIFLSTHGASIHKQCCELLQNIGYKLSPLTGSDIYGTDELVCEA